MVAATCSYCQPCNWTVTRCIDTAIINNLNVLQSKNTLEQYRINWLQSKDNLLPTLNGNALQSLNVGRTLNPVTYQFGTGTTWTTSFGLNATLNLFEGLQNLNAIKQNLAAYQSGKYDIENIIYNLRISVVNYYLQVLFAQEAVYISENQVASTLSQLENTGHFVEAGKKTESDLLQLKAQLATDKMNLVSAQSQLKTTRLNLQQLMNISVTDSFAIEPVLDTVPIQSIQENVGEAYNKSIFSQPVVKAYQLKTKSALYALRSAKGAYYPQLLFKGSFGTNYSSASKQTSVSYINNLQTIGYLQNNPSELVLGTVPQSQTTTSNYAFGNQLKDNLNTTFSIGLNIPILNYLQVRNNVSRQHINLNNAVLNEKTIKINIRKDIEQAYNDLLNAVEKYNAAKEQQSAATASYKNTETKYSNGKVTATDLIVVKTSLLKAQSDYLQAKYEWLFRSKILAYMEGMPLNF